MFSPYSSLFHKARALLIYCYYTQKHAPETTGLFGTKQHFSGLVGISSSENQNEFCSVHVTVHVSLAGIF